MKKHAKDPKPTAAAVAPKQAKKKRPVLDPAERVSFTDEIPDPKGGFYSYTPKERLFIFHYLTSAEYVATRAAKAAGYNCKNDHSFRQVAAMIMKRPHIKAAINQAFEALTMPKHEILFRLGRIAAAEITDVLNDDNDIDLAHARNAGTAFLIKKFERRRIRKDTDDGPIIEQTTKFEIHDPLKALELLGKHSKLFVERVEATGKDGTPLVPDSAAKVVVYLPDNGRGDADDETSKGKTARTIRTGSGPSKATR